MQPSDASFYFLIVSDVFQDAIAQCYRNILSSPSPAKTIVMLSNHVLETSTFIWSWPLECFQQLLALLQKEVYFKYVVEFLSSIYNFQNREAKDMLLGHIKDQTLSISDVVFEKGTENLGSNFSEAFPRCGITRGSQTRLLVCV